MLPDFQSMSVLDCLRSGALVVAFLATVFADKRGKGSVWVKVDALASVCYGLGMFLFPGVLLGYQTDGDIDNLHMYLARCAGAMMITQAAVYHLAIRERDQAPLGSWLIARTLTCLASVAVCVHGIDTYSKGSVSLNDKFRSFSFLGHSLWMLGNVIHMFRYGDYVNDGRGGAAAAGDRTRFHLLVDLMVAFPTLMYTFAFPEVMLAPVVQKVGGVHIFFVRLMSTQLLTFIMFGLVALQANSERDRRAVLLSRLIVGLLLSPVLGYYQYTYTLIAPGNYWQFVVNGLIMVNAAVGAFYRQVEDRKRK